MYSVKQLSTIILLMVALAGCDQADEQPMMQGNGPQAMPVDVADVVSQKITQWDTFTGRLASPQTVSLRPRVSGYIDFVAFNEGDWVEKGETLFLIDNRAFKAEVDRLSAQLTEAKSRLSLAESNYSRAKALRKNNSVSEDELDARSAAVEQAGALVAQTQAALDLAKLNRGFARVEAPISGRVSRANVTAGNYVNAGQTELTTIVSTDKLYAYFDIDEQTYLTLAQSNESGNGVHAKPVAMRLANESDYTHWGLIDFVDNQVSAQSGTVSVRAVFDNPNGMLLPGLFAHLKLAGQTLPDGILIAEKAIGTDLNNKYVMVVNAQNQVEYRAVTLGDKVDNLRIIKAGLSADDTIVVNGLQRVRPGALVAPNQVEMANEQTLATLQRWQNKIEAVAKLAQPEPEPEPEPVQLSAGR